MEEIEGYSTSVSSSLRGNMDILCYKCYTVIPFSAIVAQGTETDGTIGRLQLAAILVYFPKQAKITFVIHGDIGSETTKLYMIRYNVYITKQNI